MKKQAEISPQVEVGGSLVGKPFDCGGGKHEVRITDYLVGKHLQSEHHQVVFTHHTRREADAELDSLQKNDPDKIMVGWFHTHPDWGVFLSNEDLHIHQNFFKMPWQVALVFDSKQDQAGFFTWRKEGKNNIFPDRTEKQFTFSSIARYFSEAKQNQTQSLAGDNKPTNEAGFLNFTQFTPDFLNNKGYDVSIKEYQQEFERLVSQHALLAPLREHIPVMMEKGIQAVRKIKAHFERQKTTVASDALKRIFTDQWIKPFINASNFPIQRTDRETELLKKQLESAFAVLCDIELMNTILH